ncbi:MAG TPA: hypothetical protein VGF58_14680 [Burkholderiales bacterium]|jgi:hypothetical protein
MELPPELLEAEYLPLPIAALVAYYKVTDIRRRVPQDHIGETIHAMAVALSAVAPIYGPGDGEEKRCPLSAREVDELLLKPAAPAALPALDSLSIRKADMQRGIETLKASGGASWRAE